MSRFVVPHPRRPSVIQLLALGLGMMVLSALGGCGGPGPLAGSTARPAVTEVPTSLERATATATPTPTIAVTESPTPTATPFSGPTPIVPPPDQRRRMADLAFAPVPVVQPEDVRPPAARLAVLDATFARLSGDLLVNPPAAGGTVFNRERGTTYALPGPGALYQLVSLAEGVDRSFDNLDAWGDRGLAVGGLLVYQGFGNLQVDSYLVVVFKRLGEQKVRFYNSNAQPVDGPVWRLRKLDKLPHTVTSPLQPYSFVGPRRICFAQLQLQPCLDLVSPGFGDAGPMPGLARTAVATLAEHGYLSPDAQVNTQAALASIESGNTLEVCGAALASNEPQACQPDVVAAGADPILASGAVASARLSGLAMLRQADEEVVLMNIGVLEVLQPLPDAVLGFGTNLTATLPAGSYRIDFLRVFETGQDDRWLTLLSGPAGSFYTAAREIAGEGLSPEDEGNPAGTNVILDRIIWNFCHSQGSGGQCSGPRKKRPFCISWRGAGWCG